MEVSQRAQVHRTEVSLLERGGRTPRIDTVVKLAAALSIPTDRLLAGIGSSPRKRAKPRGRRAK
jgi:transcriptional regulator with XRE-family HTH domain